MNTWTVLYNGITMLTYNDGNNPLWLSSPFPTWGFSAKVGGAWHTSTIKNVNLRLRYPYVCSEMSNCCQGQSSVILSNTASITIPANTFSNCQRLTSITIADSITSIGSNAFTGSISLTCIKLNPYVSRTIATTAIPASIPTCGYYDIIRLYITNNGGWSNAGVGIAEFSFCYQTESSSSIVCSNDIGNTIISSSTVTASSSYLPYYPPSSALDNNIDTQWFTGDFGTGVSISFPRILKIVLPYRIKLFSYSIMPSWSAQSPKTWSFDMMNSIDSSMIWTSIDKRDGEVFKSLEKKSYFICSGDSDIVIPGNMPIVDNAYKGCKSVSSVIIAPFTTPTQQPTGNYFLYFYVLDQYYFI
jgi:hypothetical protein